MIRFIELIISKIRNKPFNFDPEVPLSYIISLSTSLFINLFRGFIKLHQAIYVDKGCTFKAKRKLTIGKNVRVSRNVYIDALSINGILLNDNCKISSFSFLIVSGTISSLGDSINIGKNVAIGEFSYIGGAGGVIIGDDTIIGQYLSIHPENHIFEDGSKLIREQGVSRQGVNIGKNCWIGAKVTFLDGSQVGDGCVVAAGSIVNGTFPSNVVIGGIPAKVIKKRVKSKLKNE